MASCLGKIYRITHKPTCCVFSRSKIMLQLDDVLAVVPFSLKKIDWKRDCMFCLPTV